MSVEEARKDLERRLVASDYASDDDGASIDRLILEVRAEIDCEWAGGDQIFDCTGRLGDNLYPESSRRGELCRTCTARTKLAKVTA